MRQRISITRSQFRVLVAGLFPLALIATLIPEDVVGDLIGGIFYVPFVFAHSIIHNYGDRTTIFWPYYALHLWAGAAMLASALKWLRSWPISGRLVALHVAGSVLILAYYMSAIAQSFAPAIVMPWLHPFHNSRLDPTLWIILGSAFTLSALIPKRAKSQNRTAIMRGLQDNPMQDAWFRRLRSVVLFLTAKRSRRPLYLVAATILIYAGSGLWRLTLGRQLVDTAAHGSIARARVLLLLGADPNASVYREYNERTATGDYKITALEEAVDRKSVPMVLVLINGGARVRAQSSILGSAVLSGDVAMVRLFLDHCDGPLDSGLLYEALSQPELYDLLRAHGADPDIVHGHGSTALGLAASGGEFNAADYLLEHGAHINARDGDGWTPILHAAYMEQREMIRYLYRKGADTSMDCIGDRSTQLSMDQAKRVIRNTLEELNVRHVGP